MKAKRVLPRERAHLDLGQAIDHYLRESGERAALVFIDAVEQAFAHLGHNPAIGSLRYAHELDLPGLRCWSLRRHPYVILYVERGDSLDVWRVLHAERDIPVLMRETPPPPQDHDA